MPWFPDSESVEEPDLPAPMRLPCTLDDAHVSVGVGVAIRELVAPMVDGEILGEEHRHAGEVIVASFFLPLLAREDRIAAYLGIDQRLVRQMGWRLRLAGIWQGTRLAQDCYDELMGENGNISFALFASVAVGAFFAERRDGQLWYSLQRPRPPLHVEGRPCPRDWTTLRYGHTGACVACARRSNRRNQAVKRRWPSRPFPDAG